MPRGFLDTTGATDAVDAGGAIDADVDAGGAIGAIGVNAGTAPVTTFS